MMITKQKLLVGAVMAITGTFAVQSAAQSVLEEIVVTAQKREQSLQDVGIAVTAFNAEQLRAFNVASSFDVAA